MRNLEADVALRSYLSNVTMAVMVGNTGISGRPITQHSYKMASTMVHRLQRNLKQRIERDNLS